jgi:hypothetical protein
MRPRAGGGRQLLALAAAGLACGLVPGLAQAHFEVGLQDPGLGPDGTSAQTRAAQAAMRTIAGSVVRVGLPWASVAPGGRTLPPGFRASDPGDPRYRWSAIDGAVRSAVDDHRRVLFQIADAPVWAQSRGPRRPFVSPGAWNPNPAMYAAFIDAAARRYSGSYPDPLRPGAMLPRVRDWEAWNEPNIPGDFSAPHPVSAYRTLLNRAYRVLKAVHRDNIVVLGGLAPVSPVPGSTPPLDFGADLLCLHRVGASFRRNRSCPERADFDVFAIHPYSLAATPTKHAYNPGDVLVGDMSKVGALVRTADRLHTTGERIHHRIWVTEFAWVTNPPDALLGDSEPTAARYVAYSLYQMFKSGVSLVIWLTVLDEPTDGFPGQGLYASSGRPKLTLRAFAFPCVAGVGGGHGFAWGRVPVSHRVRVIVQRAAGRGWLTVATRLTSADGVFSARFSSRGPGLYRARVLGGPTSLSYDSRPIPAKRIHANTVRLAAGTATGHARRQPTAR